MGWLVAFLASPAGRLLLRLRDHLRRRPRQLVRRLAAAASTGTRASSRPRSVSRKARRTRSSPQAVRGPLRMTSGRPRPKLSRNTKKTVAGAKQEPSSERLADGRQGRGSHRRRGTTSSGVSPGLLWAPIGERPEHRRFSGGRGRSSEVSASEALREQRAEAAVALDRGMVAVVGQLGRHRARARRGPRARRGTARRRRPRARRSGRSRRSARRSPRRRPGGRCSRGARLPGSPRGPPSCRPGPCPGCSRPPRRAGRPGDVVDPALDEQVRRRPRRSRPAAPRSRRCARRRRRSCGTRARGARALPSTRTGCARRTPAIRSRIAGSGSQSGEPAVIESPRAATTTWPDPSSAPVERSALMLSPPQPAKTAARIAAAARDVLMWSCR